MIKTHVYIYVRFSATCSPLHLPVPRQVIWTGQPVPLIIQKSDGGFGYASTDMAAVKHRVEAEGADWIIYVTDMGQSQHFDMVGFVGLASPDS
jgi:arginyl-tRNA synthetase